MKKIAIITISALALVAARAFAEAPKAAPKQEAKTEQKAEAKTDVKAEKKDCKDCPMAKKGKMCPEGKKEAKPAAEAKEGKKCCPEGHKDGKKCKDCAGKGKAEAAAKKYMCPMKCASSDKPGKCPKCGMNMEEVKPEAKK